MNFSMMDYKYKYIKVYILSAPNNLYEFSSPYNYQRSDQHMYNQKLEVSEAL